MPSSIRSIVALGVLLSIATASPAQEPDLSKRQTGIAERYQELEELLLRLAEVEAAENPERAALLRQASKQSRDKFVLQQLRNASSSLKNQKYSDALANQDLAKAGLEELLKLLTSEDRANRIRDEKKRIAKMIKDLRRIERSQRSTRARTENGAEMDGLQGEQESIGDRSEKLRNEFGEQDDNPESGDKDENEGESGEPSSEGDEPKDGEPKSNGSDGKPNGDSKASDESGEPSDEPGEPKEGEPKESDESSDPKDAGDPKDPSDSGKPSEPKESGDPESSSENSKGDSPPSDSPPQQSPSSEQPSSSPPSGGSPQNQPQPQTPEQQADQQLQKAIERMRDAEQALEESKRNDAIEDQRAAEENLRKAIDELEEILRQLREEEMERELARLESRLKKMAQMQTEILEDTVTLAETPKSQRDRQTDLKAGDLSFAEKKITVEADRAMMLLREEGSSVAFPEVIEQIREDTERVAQRLGKTQIDLVTQGIQQDILAAIEEMVLALQQAQRDLEKQKQEGNGPPPQQAGQPGEQPLVDAIAELKLIRTMETRIKTTTNRYSQLLQSDESSAQELLPLLKNLSERQDRLYRITRDLVMRRNN
ncbi:MAG: hypothetical protein AAFX06_26065 [Planctomycetota bacterium]